MGCGSLVGVAGMLDQFVIFFTTSGQALSLSLCTFMN